MTVTTSLVQDVHYLDLDGDGVPDAVLIRETLTADAPGGPQDLEVIETLEAEIDERTRLEAQVAELSEKVSHFKAMEDSLRSTLVLAQRTADEHKDSAHKEVDIAKQRAKIEIEDELRSVKQQIAEAKAELQRVSDKTAAAKLDLRNFLTRQLELIDDAHPTIKNAVAKV